MAGRCVPPGWLRAAASVIDAAGILRALVSSTLQPRGSTLERWPHDLPQHLALLREDNRVTTRRESRTICYSLADGPAQRIIATRHGIYCAGDRPLCEES